MRRTVTRAVCALFVAGALVGAQAATAAPSEDTSQLARPSAGASTPELIEQDIASGAIDRATGDLYLAYAFGAPGKLPGRYISNVPWHGTLPLLKLQERLPATRVAFRSEIEQILKPVPTTALAPGGGTCGSSSASLPNGIQSAHFFFEYDTIGAGLTATDYVNSLETSWVTEVSSWGWAAPPVLTSNPPPGNTYHVRADTLSAGLYGFATTSGTHAGVVGNNPNTPWNEGDAAATCVVLNKNYTGFPSPPQAALDSTTAHEFNHALQFGYGGLSGANTPDDVFVEGGATWAEEVFDNANDNYNYLWPRFDDSMGVYNGSPYPYWVTFRGLTERFGQGVGLDEQVMQDFWEETSKNTGNNLTAMQTALANKGTTLPDAYHAYAVAVKFNRACGGGYVYPYCFEEGPSYVTAAGPTAVHRTIATVGANVTNTLEDNYALNWVQLPTASGTYSVTLDNTSIGGSLRGSVACDTGSAIQVSALPAVVGAAGTTTLTGFNSAPCTSAVAVITNQLQTAPNPSTSTLRSFRVSTSSGSVSPDISINDAQVTEGAAATTTPLSFNVTLSPASSQTVTVGYTTVGGTATAGTDFLAATGTVTFNPTETTKPVVVTVNGDNVDESDEQFTVVLSSPVNATIADGTGVGTILDDDGPPTGRTVSISDGSGPESSGKTSTATFVVTISSPPAGKSELVRVNYVTSNGTAVAPGDYTARTGTITFGTGQTTATIAVTIINDTIAEGPETFTVTLSAPVGATITDGSAVGTIIDND